MASPASPSYIAIAIFVVVIGWRLYSRTRRSFGRQRSSRIRPWVTIAMLTLIAGVVTWQSAGAPGSQLALAGGLAVGVGLGLVGIRMTKFERTEEGLFYTPSAHIGIALTALVVGRLVYRMAMLRGAMTSPPQVAQSPLTLGLFGMLAGYYACYAFGLIRWRTRALKDPADAPNPSPATKA